MSTEKMSEDQGDFYNKMREKVQGWAKSKSGKENKWMKYVLLAPDIFVLLGRLALDKDVPAKEKAKVAGAIAYFVMPIDLIPDAIPVIGLLDDVIVAVVALNSIINNVDPEIVRKHWSGEGDILEVVKHIIELANEMVGEGLFGKIKSMFGFK